MDVSRWNQWSCSPTQPHPIFFIGVFWRPLARLTDLSEHKGTSKFDSSCKKLSFTLATTTATFEKGRLMVNSRSRSVGWARPTTRNLFSTAKMVGTLLPLSPSPSKKNRFSEHFLHISFPGWPFFSVSSYPICPHILLVRVYAPRLRKRISCHISSARVSFAARQNRQTFGSPDTENWPRFSPLRGRHPSAGRRRRLVKSVIVLAHPSPSLTLFRKLVYFAND